MALSCSCDLDYGILCVRIKEVTCRTPRTCESCGKNLSVLDRMYMYSMFDHDEMSPSRPIFFCEECGDLAETLSELGFCYNLGEGIRDQWFDYLYDIEPTNVALKNTLWDQKKNKQPLQGTSHL